MQHLQWRTMVSKHIIYYIPVMGYQMDSHGIAASGHKYVAVMQRYAHSSAHHDIVR
jgi:hypothetical protein